MVLGNWRQDRLMWSIVVNPRISHPKFHQKWVDMKHEKLMVYLCGLMWWLMLMLCSLLDEAYWNMLTDHGHRWGVPESVEKMPPGSGTVNFFSSWRNEQLHSVPKSHPFWMSHTVLSVSGPNPRLWKSKHQPLKTTIACSYEPSSQ